MKVVNITEEELCSFIKSLEPKLGSIGKIVTYGKTWDTAARHLIGERMHDWFKEYFGSRTLGDNWKNCFGYEGQKRNF
jgi:hypothetical protein